MALTAGEEEARRCPLHCAGDAAGARLISNALPTCLRRTPIKQRIKVFL